MSKETGKLLTVLKSEVHLISEVYAIQNWGSIQFLWREI